MSIPKITFIIPTIGRDTLINSINSLLNQTYIDWNAIIIFDGIKSNIDINDERIKIIECEKKGLNFNSAALVRNYGISFAKTYWIAFLDDDDIISNDYIETFYNEISNRYVSVIQFLNETDENDLKVKDLELNAETLEKEVVVVGREGKSVFARNSILEKIPMKRMGQASEVADAALFLASDLSTYVSGQVLSVCGGMNR